MQDVLELIAVRLADADLLRSRAGGEAADRIVLEHVAAAEPGAGGKPVLHGVGNELRPAFAPQIVGHLGAVGVSDQPADFFGALGDAAVHLAGAKHGMRGAVLGGAAMNEAGAPAG